MSEIRELLKIWKRLSIGDVLMILLSIILFLLFLHWKNAISVQAPTADGPILAFVRPLLPAVEALLGFLFITLLLGSISNRSLVQQIEDSVVQTLKDRRNYEKLGLCEVVGNYNELNLKDLIEEARSEIYYVGIYSVKIILNYEAQLKKFAGVAGHKVHIILTNPQSAFSQICDDKFKILECEEGRARVRDNIEHSVNKLKTVFRKSAAEVFIYYLDIPLSYSALLSDRGLAMTPYLITPSRDQIPAFQFRKTSQDKDFFAIYSLDIQDLIGKDYARRIWSNHEVSSNNPPQ